MKRIVCFSIMAIVMMVLLSSCDSKKSKVERVVKAFAEAVSQKDAQTISTVYPTAATCDSLSLFSQEEKINVEKTETEGTFVAKVGDKEFTVVEGEDGTMTITDSRNVFCYPQKKTALGLATGWIEEKMSDAEMAERFADTSFVSFLSETLFNEMKGKVRVIDWIYGMRPMDIFGSGMKYVPLQFKVDNDTDYDIAPEDYVIEIVVSYLRVAGVGNKTMEVKGETLPANSSTIIKYNLKPVYDDPNLFEGVDGKKLVFKLSKEEMLQKYFVPKGGEYQSYLYAKK